MPLTELRFRCSHCGTDRTDFVVTWRDNPAAVVIGGRAAGRIPGSPFWDSAAQVGPRPTGEPLADTATRGRHRSP